MRYTRPNSIPAKAIYIGTQIMGRIKYLHSCKEIFSL
jgi:hypothetical protein